MASKSTMSSFTTDTFYLIQLHLSEYFTQFLFCSTCLKGQKNPVWQKSHSLFPRLAAKRISSVMMQLGSREIKQQAKAMPDKTNAHPEDCHHSQSSGTVKAEQSLPPQCCRSKHLWGRRSTGWLPEGVCSFKQPRCTALISLGLINQIKTFAKATETLALL